LTFYVSVEPKGRGFRLVNIDSSSLTDETAVCVTVRPAAPITLAKSRFHQTLTQIAQTYRNPTPEIEFACLGHLPRRRGASGGLRRSL
jgi:hypothetical protein